MSAVTIELVYERTCPNIKAARLGLLKAFAKTGVTPHWQEWEVNQPDAPAHVHGYGSPTILVNGQDVSSEPMTGNDYCCRLYSQGNHANKGVPAESDIMHALISAKQNRTSTHPPRWRLNGAMLPAFGVAFLPKLACPACWPAYAGLLGALGISFFDYTPYLLPITGVFLFIAVAGLAYRAQARRGFGPLLVGLVAAGLLLTGKFYFDSDFAMYAGLSLLMLASLWNTWPGSQSADAPCPSCETLHQKQSE